MKKSETVMKKLALTVGFMLVWGIWAGCNVAYAECYSVNNNTLLLPCVQFQGTTYKVNFSAYQDYWKLGDIGLSDTPNSEECGSLYHSDTTWVFTLPCRNGKDTKELYLHHYDASGCYLKQIGIDNVAVPSSVEANKSFPISFSYNHPDGLNRIKEIQIWMSDYQNAPTETFDLNGAGNGSFTRDGYGFNQFFLGDQWIEIWIIDFQGRICKKRISISVVTCSSCDSSCNNGHLPYIVNNQVTVNNNTVGNNQQVSAEVSKEFNISFSYNHPDGLSNVKEIHLKMSDEKIDYKYSPDSTGTFIIGAEFLPPYTGSQWIEVWVVDSCGRICEVIRIIIIVGGSCNSDGCYPSSSCTTIRGKWNAVQYQCCDHCYCSSYYISGSGASDIDASLPNGSPSSILNKTCTFYGCYSDDSVPCYSWGTTYQTCKIFHITSYSDCR
jgi:hypothetical protein